MEKRTLGNSGIEVYPLALGGNVFGWTIGERESFEILDGFVSEGYDFIDTADVYSRWKPGNSGGESETIIGKWMQERKNRDDIVLATKVGGDMGAGKSLSKDYIIRAVEASLERLKTDYIDLYQSHFDDEKTSVNETLEAYDHLIKSGKIKAIGASNFSISRLRESIEYSKQHNLPAYQTFQPEYNLYEREKFETEYKDYCKENDIAVICYYALASGFLTGKYRSEEDFSKSARGSGIKKYLNARGMKILKELDEISERYNASPATIALAWIQSHEGVIPIASATKIKQLEEITAAGHIDLDMNTISLLNDASEY